MRTATEDLGRDDKNGVDKKESQDGDGSHNGDGIAGRPEGSDHACDEEDHRNRK